MSEIEDELLRQIQFARLPEPEREYRFASPRRWRFDFAYPSRYLAVEVEGATWTGGRHTRGAGYEADCEKYSVAAILGWRVLRVTSSMIRDGRALALLEQALGAMEEERKAC